VSGAAVSAGSVVGASSAGTADSIGASVAVLESEPLEHDAAISAATATTANART
jgi:hypothetical protein